MWNKSHVTIANGMPESEILSKNYIVTKISPVLGKRFAITDRSAAVLEDGIIDTALVITAVVVMDSFFGSVEVWTF